MRPGTRGALGAVRRRRHVQRLNAWIIREVIAIYRAPDAAPIGLMPALYAAGLR